MPQAIPAIAAWVGGLFAGGAAAVGFSAAAAYAIGTAVAYTFYYAAYAYLINRAVSALTPRPKGGRGTSLELNYAGPSEPRRIVYGLQRLGGMHTIPGFCSGVDGKYLHMVYTIAGHEVNDITDVHLDNNTINDASIGAISESSSSGLVSSGKYANIAWIRRYMGTAAQTRDYILNQAHPSAFTSDFRGRGIAYVAVQLKWDKNVFQGGVPQFTAMVQGRKLYDPRDASTIYKTNPALAVRNFLVDEVGFDATEIDDTLVIAAANICDQTVSIPGAGTQPRYTCNVTLFAAEKWEDNLRTLVDTMHGRIVWRDGKWRIYAGAWDTPSMSITKADWVSPTVVRASVDRDERWNAMRLFYVDPNRNWQRVECYPRRNAGYETDDGGDRIWRQAEIAGCINEYEAQRHAEFYLRQGRNQLRISGVLRPEFIALAPSDTVTVTDDEYGWSSKTFRVISMEASPTGGVAVVLVEEGSATWTDLAVGEYNSEPTLPTIDPGATLPGQPLSLVASGGRGYIDFAWQAGSEDIPGQTYRLIEGPNSADATTGVEAWRGLAMSYRLGKSDTTTRWYWVQGVVGSYLSAYSPNTFGVVACASGPPGDGTPGTYAPALKLDHNGQLFRYSGSHTNIGVSTIEFNATIQGVGGTAAMYAQNYRADGTALNSYNLSGTGNGPRGLHINSFTQNNSTAYCVVVASVSGGLYDQVTIMRVMEGAGGQNALVGYLTNEVQVLPSSSNGFVPSYTGANGAMVLMLGINSVNVNSITFSVAADPQTLTEVFSTNGTYAVTGGFDVGEELATLTLRGTYDGSNVDKVFHLSKSKGGIVGDPGADGADAQFLALYATSQQFRYSGSGTNIGVNTIGFTAFLQNIAGTAGFYANNYLANGTLINSVALAGAGNSDRGFHINSFTQGGSTAYAVIVSSISGPFTDRVTVVRLQEGATGDPGVDAVVGYLTNEAHTLQASYNGFIPSYAGAVGEFQVFDGITRVNVNSITFVSSALAPAGLTKAITANGSYSVTGGIGEADEQGLALFRATYNTVQIDKVFTVAKARGGTPGDMGPPGANMIPNGMMELVNVATDKLQAWSGVSSQHTYNDTDGIDGTRCLVVNSFGSTLTVMNEAWIAVDPLNEQIDVTAWLRSPTSGQTAYLLVDARDQNKVPIQNYRACIDGIFHPFQNYSAGATSVRVNKPAIVDGGFRGYDATATNNYALIPHKLTRTSSWGLNNDIIRFPRDTQINTAIQITSVNTAGSTSYDTLTLESGLPLNINTHDYFGFGRATGGTYKYFPSGAAITVTSAWKAYRWSFRGFATGWHRFAEAHPQTTEHHAFRPHTAHIRFGLLANAGGVRGPLHVDQYVATRRAYASPSQYCHDPQMAFGGGAWFPSMASSPAYNDATNYRLKYQPTGGWSGFGCLVLGTGANTTYPHPINASVLVSSGDDT